MDQGELVHSPQESNCTPPAISPSDSFAESSTPSSSSSLLEETHETAPLELCGLELDIRVADVCPESHSVTHDLPKQCAPFKRMRSEGEGFDVVVNVGGHSIPAHKPDLSTMLNFKESSMGEIDLKGGIDHSSLHSIIDYCYTGRVIITEEKVWALLQGADFLSMDQVVAECASFLRARTTINNVLQLQCDLQSIGFYGLDQFLPRFCDVNFVPFSRTQSFLELSFDEFSCLLMRDTIHVDSEQQVFEAVDRWVKHDTERSQFGPRLDLSIRLSLLPSPFISGTVKRTKWVQESDDCIAIVNAHKAGASVSITTKRGCPDAHAIIAVMGVSFTVSDPLPPLGFYDPVEDRWTCGNLEHDDAPSAYTHYVVTIGHKMYFLGPAFPCIYDVIANECHEPMLELNEEEDRWYTSRGLIGNKIYVAGGCYVEGDECLSTCFSLDTTNLAAGWKEVGELKGSRMLAASCIYNGKMWVFGGQTVGEDIIDTAEEYDPVEDEWKRLPSMDYKRKDGMAIAFQDKIHVVGGKDSLTRGAGYSKVCEQFDPKTQKWTRLANTNHPRCGDDLAVCSGRLFLIGDPALPIEEYLPEADQWVERATCPIAREDFPSGYHVVTLPIPASFLTSPSALK